MSDEPTPTKGRELVRPHVERLFAEILDAQCVVGEATYGRRLETFNGQRATRALLPELVDAFQYSVQEEMEREKIVRAAMGMAKELRKRAYTDLCCGDIREVLAVWDELGLEETPCR